MKSLLITLAVLGAAFIGVTAYNRITVDDSATSREVDRILDEDCARQVAPKAKYCR